MHCVGKGLLRWFDHIGNRYAFDEYMNSQLGYADKAVQPVAALLNIDSRRVSRKRSPSRGR